MNLQEGRKDSLSQPVRPPRMARSTSKESSTGLLMSVIRSLTASRDNVERDREKANLQREFQDSDGRLDTLVLNHHTDLTAVMGAFSKISTRLHSSKDRVQGVREKLVICQQLLHCKRDELKRLWLESVENKHVLRMLDQIETLTKVPHDVRNFVNKKHYRHATKLLTGSITVLEGDLRSVDALSEVKSELIAKKEEIYELLLDDLHKHIYSRSTAEVLQRLKREGPDRRQTSHEGTPSRKVSVADILSPNSMQTAANLARRKSPSSLPQIEDVNGQLIENLMAVDPEEDSRLYVAIIIECFATLRRSADAIEAIKVRADKELINIVKRTGRELFDSTHETHLFQAGASQLENSLPANLRESLTTGVPDNKAPLLQELLDVLYSQFQCVVDIHEHMIIPRFQREQECQRTASPTGAAEEGVQVYTIDEIWAKIQVVLQLVADLYIEMCTAASERHNVNVAVNGNDETTLSHSGATVSDLNNYFARKRGISAAVGGGFGKAKKCPLFRFDSSSHAISLNAYLREQKEAMREKAELTGDALDYIDIERILGFVGK